jgi:hypothetical protein
MLRFAQHDSAIFSQLPSHGIGRSEQSPEPRQGRDQRSARLYAAPPACGCRPYRGSGIHRDASSPTARAVG